jgi:hypothetical protein
MNKKQLPFKDFLFQEDLFLIYFRVYPGSFNGWVGEGGEVVPVS